MEMLQVRKTITIVSLRLIHLLTTQVQIAKAIQDLITHLQLQELTIRIQDQITQRILSLVILQGLTILRTAIADLVTLQIVIVAQVTQIAIGLIAQVAIVAQVVQTVVLVDQVVLHLIAARVGRVVAVATGLQVLVILQVQVEAQVARQLEVQVVHQEAAQVAHQVEVLAEEDNIEYV
jgi:hypothetical protein